METDFIMSCEPSVSYVPKTNSGFIYIFFVQRNDFINFTDWKTSYSF